jgi:putative acetyltransferase
MTHSPDPIELRPAGAGDLEALAACFTEAVHGLTAAHYDAAQRAAWAPVPADLAAFAARLAGRRVLVAASGGAILGFVAYEDEGAAAHEGHIDLLYTAPFAARRGIATRLHEAAEERLRALGRTALRTEASLIAEPFFAGLGYRPVERQRVERGGQILERVAMRKDLDPAAPRRSTAGLAGLLALTVALLAGAHAPAQGVVGLGGRGRLDARIRATALVEVARVAIDAGTGEASWRTAVDSESWRSDPAQAVALSLDGQHLGLVFRTASGGTRAVAFALDSGERTELGSAGSIATGAGGAEFLLRVGAGFRTVAAASGEARDEPLLRGLGRVELAPGRRHALVEDPGARRVAGPTRITLRDPVEATLLARGQRLIDAAWTADGRLLAAAIGQRPAGGPALGEGAVFLLAGDGEPLRIEAVDGQDGPGGVEFSADGRTLYVLTHREILAVDLQSLEVESRRPAVLESFAVLDPVIGIGFHAQGGELWDLRRLERIRAVPLELPAAPTDHAGLRRLRELGVDGRVQILDSAVRAPIGRAAIATRAGVVVYELRR